MKFGQNLGYKIILDYHFNTHIKAYFCHFAFQTILRFYSWKSDGIVPYLTQRS